MNISLVILHGWGVSVKSYDKLKPLLEQKGISVFVFDLPGFGSEPAPREAWSVDDYVEWVKNKITTIRHFQRNKGRVENLIIKDSSPLAQNDDKNSSGTIDKFILFGHSFGGRIAIKFATKYPEKLAGLILCDAAGVTPRPKIKIKFFHALSKSGKIIFSLPLLKYFQPIVRKIEYFLAGSRDYYYLQNSIMKKVFNNVINEDLTAHLEKIVAPTLVVWGKKDKMTPISDAYIMHNKIKNSELEILAGVGHSPHLEIPEELANIVEKFIKKV